MVIPAGTRFSHFVVHSLLGTGGMGEVYLAEDTRLGRKIALKLLPENFTLDPNRLRRFEQEARTASALNHPNILTIYEIGSVDSVHFIATELVEGVTLRKRISDRRLKLSEVLEIAIQTASALAAAHHAGIVHRDVKPENIMLRRDGYVKVLDFGLAKLTEHSSSSIDTQSPTQTKAASTDPGTVLGTAKYMSPEQARGYEVDVRTDIWSLGVVIYEMVAGRAPFDGSTRSDVIAAILKLEPAEQRRRNWKIISDAVRGEALEVEPRAAEQQCVASGAQTQRRRRKIPELSRVRDHHRSGIQLRRAG
jgi:serine/threonine protein kinase